VLYCSICDNNEEPVHFGSIGRLFLFYGAGNSRFGPYLTGDRDRQGNNLADIALGFGAGFDGGDCAKPQAQPGCAEGLMLAERFGMA